VLRLLREIHAEYYAAYDAHVASLEGARAGAAPLPLPSVPDIISRLLRRVLADTCIVFSGVFPLGGHGGEDTRLWSRALAFGAAVAEAPDATRCRAGAFSEEDLRAELAAAQAGAGGAGGAAAPGGDAHASAAAYHALQRFNRRVATHVVARTPGTAKVKAGASDAAARVVHLSWLEQSLLQYTRLPEADFAAALGPGPLAACASREQSARVADLRELKRLALAEAVARTRAAAALRAQQGGDDDEDEDEEEDAGEGEGEEQGEGDAAAAAPGADGAADEPARPRRRHRAERDDGGESVAGQSTASSGAFLDELEHAFGEGGNEGEGDGDGAEGEGEGEGEGGEDA
jgi:hypothetical protein